MIFYLFMPVIHYNIIKSFTPQDFDVHALRIFYHFMSVIDLCHCKIIIKFMTQDLDVHAFMIFYLFMPVIDPNYYIITERFYNIEYRCSCFCNFLPIHYNIIKNFIPQDIDVHALMIFYLSMPVINLNHYIIIKTFYNIESRCSCFSNFLPILACNSLQYN